MDGNKTPYKILFDGIKNSTKPYVDKDTINLGDDWFSERDLKSLLASSPTTEIEYKILKKRIGGEFDNELLIKYKDSKGEFQQDWFKTYCVKEEEMPVEIFVVINKTKVDVKREFIRELCRDCICLVGGDKAKWVCDELGENIEEISGCPEGLF